MCSGRVDSSCSTSGTRRVALSFIVHMVNSYIHSQKYRKNAKTSINVTTKFVSEKYSNGESIKEYLKFLVHEEWLWGKGMNRTLSPQYDCCEASLQLPSACNSHHHPAIPILQYIFWIQEKINHHVVLFLTGREIIFWCVVSNSYRLRSRCSS